jgi:hypothetical protein
MIISLYFMSFAVQEVIPAEFQTQDFQNTSKKLWQLQISA